MFTIEKQAYITQNFGKFWPFFLKQNYQLCPLSTEPVLVDMTVLYIETTCY